MREKIWCSKIHLGNLNQTISKFTKPMFSKSHSSKNFSEKLLRTQYSVSLVALKRTQKYLKIQKNWKIYEQFKKTESIDPLATIRICFKISVFFRNISNNENLRKKIVYLRVILKSLGSVYNIKMLIYKKKKHKYWPLTIFLRKAIHGDTIICSLGLILL